MRNKYIGDSLDLAKAELLRIAAAARLATLVAPLPAEQGFDFDRYRTVLGIGAPHVLAGPELPRYSGRGRARLLHALAGVLEAGELAGLLLDPDTGIRQEAGHGPGFLTVAELRQLVRGRAVTWLLYHHQRAGNLSYGEAAQLTDARWYYDFGKAAVLVGGEAYGSEALLAAARERLNPARCVEAAG